jgi:hypothetical protein
LFASIAFQQICKSIHRVRLGSLIDGYSSKSHRDSPIDIALISKRNSGAQYLFMYFAMMLLTEWRNQFRVVILPGSVVQLNAKNA